MNKTMTCLVYLFTKQGFTKQRTKQISRRIRKGVIFSYREMNTEKYRKKTQTAKLMFWREILLSKGDQGLSRDIWLTEAFLVLWLRL